MRRDQDSTAGCRWWATASLVFLEIYFILFAIFALVDYSGYFVFGAGAFYIVLLCLHIIPFMVWVICSSVDAHNKKNNAKKVALFHYPRYTWDIWTFVTSNVLVFALLCSLLVSYMSLHGLNANPHFPTAPTYDEVADVFQTNDLLIAITYIILFIQTMDAFTAYSTKIYQLVKPSEWSNYVDSNPRIAPIILTDTTAPTTTFASVKINMSGRRLMKEREDIPFGEIVSFAPEMGRWTPLAIVQGLTTIFMFVTFILTLLETQYVRYLNVYVYTIVYGVVGIVLVLIAQIIAWIIYMRQNRAASKDSPDTDYVGAYQIRELVIGFVISIVAFLVNVWQLINFLTRFDKTCCTATRSAPDTSDPIQWRVFYGTMVVCTVTSLTAVFLLLRSLYAHFNPLRSISPISLTSSRTN